MMTDMNELEENELGENEVQGDGHKGNTKPILITAAIAGGALVLCLCILIVIALIFDPWGIVSRIKGDYDPIAQAIPADVSLFMNVNLLQLQSKDTFDFINTFLEAAGEETIADIHEFIDKLDVEADAEITFIDDIQPWIGQYIGLGVSEISSIDGVNPDARFYLLAEVRSKKKADEFLIKILDEIEEQTETVFIESDYQKTIIYSLDVEDMDESIALARYGSLLLLSNGESGIIEIIDLQKESSLSENEVYQNIMSELPTDRLLAAYIDLSFLEDIYEGVNLPVEVDTDVDFSVLEGIGVSASLQDVGLQMDYIISYDIEQMSDEEQENFQIEPGELVTSHLFPEDTLLYISSEGLGKSLEALQTQALALYEEEELEEAMDLFEIEFGFNPNTDLYPYIDGEWGIGVMESETGLLAEQLGIELSLLITVESSDQEMLLSSAEKIADGLEQSLGLPIIRSESNGMNLFEIGGLYSQEPTLVFAVNDNMLLISIETETVENAYGDRHSLAQNPRYVEGWNNFSGMRPIAYMDLEGTLELYLEMFGNVVGDDEVESLDALRPLKTLQIAGSVIDEHIIHSRMFIFIK